MLAHGSVVGLYAVLANVPHICTATTGSLVQAFFLPRDPIMEASRSSYEVLDFLWLVGWDGWVAAGLGAG